MDMNKRFVLLLSICGLMFSACNSPDSSKSEKPAEVVAKPAGFKIYVTNENSGDVSVIDSNTNEVVSTIMVGKRPRGIHVSPDKKTLYVALSGSPIAGPGVDEKTLPPADKAADGIGVLDP